MSLHTPVTEAALERQFDHAVRTALRGITYKVVPIVVGSPDRLVLLPGGRAYLVELKTARGRLRPAQRMVAASIATTGHKVHVVYGQSGLRAWLRARANEAAAMDPPPTVDEDTTASDIQEYL